MDTTGLVLGADGGGTKTVAVLADMHGREIARSMAGASNPNVVGFDASTARLIEVVDGCCAAAGCAVGDIAAVVFGLAGGGSAENRKELLARLCAHYGSTFPASIETDARIALEGALTGGPGVAIIAGTGSVIVAKTSSGEVFTVGGWGRALGDEGSGFFIGIEALKAMAKSIDGMLTADALREALHVKFGWTSREHVIGAVYREKIEPSSLAPIVLDLAGSGDAVCRDILRRAAGALADQLGAALHRLGMDRVRVATCGGLIDHPTSYREVLAAELARRDKRVTVKLPENPAVDGAVLMAIARIQKGAMQ